MKVLEEIIRKLPEARTQHARSGAFHASLGARARQEVERLFSSRETKAVDFPPFGPLIFPYHKMGAIDSLNLFDLDELIIFSFYWQNRKRYKRVADIGANIGLHSLILSKCGYEVRSFEPDPQHFEVIKRNLALNRAVNVKPVNAAVSNRAGEMEFTRVLGNTTGSHLSGSKADPYGELERFAVRVESIVPIIEWADLIKLDAEGHEKEIVLATKKEHWLKTDAVVEVENQKNAETLFDFFTDAGINMFSQKRGWQKVKDIRDVPIGYKEGSLFVSAKGKMPWNEGDQ